MSTALWIVWWLFIAANIASIIANQKARENYLIAAEQYRTAMDNANNLVRAFIKANGLTGEDTE